MPAEAQKLPFVLRYTIWERLPFLVLAAVAFFVARPAPDLALALTLVMLLTITSAGGLLMPAWMDIVGRAVPVGLRGRFFAVSSLLLCLLAVSFAGSGLYDLIAAGYLPPHPVHFPEISWMGVHGDLAVLLVQSTILLVVLAAGLHTLRAARTAATE